MKIKVELQGHSQSFESAARMCEAAALELRAFERERMLGLSAVKERHRVMGSGSSEFHLRTKITTTCGGGR